MGVAPRPEASPHERVAQERRAHESAADRQVRLRADRARAERPPGPDRAGIRRRSRLGRFTSSYGWRAYAIPVLVVITVLAVFGGTQPEPEPEPDTGTGVAAPVRTDPATSAAEEAPSDFGPRSTDDSGPEVVSEAPPGDGSSDAQTAPGALPDGGAFPESGDGTWRVLPGSGEQVGEGTELVSTFTVEVEGGMDTSGFGGDESFAQLVEATLADAQGWTGDGRFAFRRIDAGEPDFRVMLTSQLTVREVCGYSIMLEVSCRAGEQVIVNVARWVRGAISFQGDIGSYRQYLVNHEVGHAIGFREHPPCASDGGLAPIMMQQTLSTANDEVAALNPQGAVPADGAVCRFNPWPFPRT